MASCFTASCWLSNDMKYTTYLILALFITSCNKQNLPIEKASWLIGTWESKSPEGVFIEQWEKKSNSLFTGKGNMIVGQDTVFSELLAIQQRGNDVYYIATIPGENDGKPTDFKLTSSDNALVFENPGHDYPQKIIYTQKDDSSILVEVSGNINGKPQKESFPFKKVKSFYKKSHLMN